MSNIRKTRNAGDESSQSHSSITTAAVRFKDDNADAFVKISAIKDFKPRDCKDFTATKFYKVFYQDKGSKLPGGYLPARILMLGGSIAELEESFKKTRLRVPKLNHDDFESEDEEESTDMKQVISSEKNIQKENNTYKKKANLDQEESIVQTHNVLKQGSHDLPPVPAPAVSKTRAGPPTALEKSTSKSFNKKSSRKAKKQKRRESSSSAESVDSMELVGKGEVDKIVKDMDLLKRRMDILNRKNDLNVKEISSLKKKLKDLHKRLPATADDQVPDGGSESFNVPIRSNAFISSIIQAKKVEERENAMQIRNEASGLGETCEHSSVVKQADDSSIVDNDTIMQMEHEETLNEERDDHVDTNKEAQAHTEKPRSSEFNPKTQVPPGSGGVDLNGSALPLSGVPTGSPPPISSCKPSFAGAGHRRRRGLIMKPASAIPKNERPSAKVARKLGMCGAIPILEHVIPHERSLYIEKPDHKPKRYIKLVCDELVEEDSYYFGRTCLGQESNRNRNNPEKVQESKLPFSPSKLKFLEDALEKRLTNQGFPKAHVEEQIMMIPSYVNEKIHSVMKYKTSE